MLTPIEIPKEAEDDRYSSTGYDPENGYQQLPFQQFFRCPRSGRAHPATLKISTAMMLLRPTISSSTAGSTSMMLDLRERPTSPIFGPSAINVETAVYWWALIFYLIGYNYKVFLQKMWKMPILLFHWICQYVAATGPETPRPVYQEQDVPKVVAWGSGNFGNRKGSPPMLPERVISDHGAHIDNSAIDEFLR
ncbi:hypothetical protein Unana1_02662 [Umbelopsis nana]